MTNLDFDCVVALVSIGFLANAALWVFAVKTMSAWADKAEGRLKNLEWRSNLSTDQMRRSRKEPI